MMLKMITILGLLTMGSAAYNVHANAPTHANGFQSDSYNTKPFFDKEKEINQGKNIIIKP
jgi:hypothetical protein